MVGFCLAAAPCPAEPEGASVIANAVLAWVVIGGGLLLALLWLGRELAHWYWRIPEMLALLERQARASERTAAAIEEFNERTRPGR